jgi:hypothetical protein
VAHLGTDDVFLFAFSFYSIMGVSRPPCTIVSKSYLQAPIHFTNEHWTTFPANSFKKRDSFPYGACVKQELHELNKLWSDIYKSFWRPTLGYAQQVRTEGFSS